MSTASITAEISSKRFVLILFATIIICINIVDAARGGRRGGKGKGKSNLQFAQVAEFSLVQGPPSDSRVKNEIV